MTEPIHPQTPTEPGAEPGADAITQTALLGHDLFLASVELDALREQRDHFAAVLERLHRDGKIGPVCKPAYSEVLRERDRRVGMALLDVVLTGLHATCPGGRLPEGVQGAHDYNRGWDAAVCWAMDNVVRTYDQMAAGGCPAPAKRER